MEIFTNPDKPMHLYYIGKDKRKYYFKNLTGLTFGRWRVLSFAGKNKFGQLSWLCRCECVNGKSNESEVVGTTLMHGSSSSCGCTSGLKHRRYLGKTKPERDRARRLKRIFNLTIKDYEKMLQYQDGVCAITGKLAKKLVIDHDHSNGLIRGLLDWRINKALAPFKDNPALLRAAADYLENPPAATALGEKVYGILGKTTKKPRNMRYGPLGTLQPKVRTQN